MTTGLRSGAATCLSRGYAAASAAVSLALILALARADYLVGETSGKACGSPWDVVRWSSMVSACTLSDLDRFDVVNGGIVVLGILAALTLTLLVLRIALLVPVLMYLGDAGRMHAEFVATRRIYPGIEFWWLPISGLSAVVLVVATVDRAKRWRGVAAAAPPHPRSANLPDGSG